MAELLTSLDVVNQSFRKSIRGYDAAEVDAFLDGVAESLQAYAQKNKDMERELTAKTENLAEYEKTKSVLHEALLLAQKSSDEKIRRAETESERIVAEAMERADAIYSEAEREAGQLREGVAHIRNVRQLYEQEFRGLLAKFDNMLNQLENGSAMKSAVDAILQEEELAEEQTAEYSDDGDEGAPEEEPHVDRQDLENAFNALGVDPRTILDDLGPKRGR